MVVPKSSSDDSAIVYGIVSDTIEKNKTLCATGIFTKVSKYLKWIRSHMKNKTENGTVSQRTLKSGNDTPSNNVLTYTQSFLVIMLAW